MGAMKGLMSEVQDIAFETVDLFYNRVILRLSGNKIIFECDTGESVTVEIVLGNEKLDVSGIHIQARGLDPYFLVGIVERAIHNSYETIYIHLGAPSK